MFVVFYKLIGSVCSGNPSHLHVLNIALSQCQRHFHSQRYFGFRFRAKRLFHVVGEDWCENGRNNCSGRCPYKTKVNIILLRTSKRARWFWVLTFVLHNSQEYKISLTIFNYNLWKVSGIFVVGGRTVTVGVLQPTDRKNPCTSDRHPLRVSSPPQKGTSVPVQRSP